MEKVPTLHILGPIFKKEKKKKVGSACGPVPEVDLYPSCDTHIERIAETGQVRLQRKPV